MIFGLGKPQSYTSTWPINQKSPLIWAPSDGIALRDGSLGYIVDEHFDHSFWPAQLTYQDAGSTAASGVSYYNANPLSTSTSPSGGDHVLLMVPGSTASLAGRIALFTRPLRSVTPGGNYVIFEAGVTVENAGATQGFFIGLTTSTGLPGVVGDTGILKTVSGTAASNALKASTGAIGFWMHGDTPNNCDAVYQNQYSAGTAASGIQTVVSNVLTAATFNANPGNVYQQPIVAPGVFNSTTLVKLGLYYNAPSNLLVYTVNGYQVGSAAVTSLGFDVLNDYGAVVEYGATNGATVSTGLVIDFLSVAGKIQL